MRPITQRMFHKPSRPQKSRVQKVGAIGSSDNKDIAFPPSRYTVKFSEKLAYNTVHNTARVSLVASLRRDRIKLIEKYDAWFCIPSTLKYASNVCFGLSNVHVQKFWSFH